MLLDEDTRTRAYYLTAETVVGGVFTYAVDGSWVRRVEEGTTVSVWIIVLSLGLGLSDQSRFGLNRSFVRYSCPRSQLRGSACAALSRVFLGKKYDASRRY